MSVPLLVLQAAVFALWAWAAFAALFDCRRRAVARAGGPFPGPRAQLAALRDWARDPAARADRRRLLALTALLAGLGVAQAAAGEGP